MLRKAAPSTHEVQVINEAFGTAKRSPRGRRRAKRHPVT
jgi:hypothetical protein